METQQRNKEIVEGLVAFELALPVPGIKQVTFKLVNAAWSWYENNHVLRFFFSEYVLIHVNFPGILNFASKELREQCLLC